MASDIDVYKLLTEKENDLQLAAELGKALLDKNELMTKEYDKSIYDYGQQIEKLKHENSWLKAKLANNSDELDEAMREHEEDLKNLREQLSDKAKAFSLHTNNMQNMNQLAQQNQRLSAELDKVLEQKAALQTKNGVLKIQVDEFQVTNDTLSSENAKLQDKAVTHKRKLQDVEQELSQSQRVTEQIRLKADELSYCNTLLSNEKQEIIEQIRVQEKQIEMLKDKNTELFEQITELANSPTAHGPSILEELEYSQKSLTSGYSSNLSLLDELDSDDAITQLPVDNFSQLKIEVRDVYQELQAIIEDLETSECASNVSKEKISSKDISNGELISVAKHVRYLVTRRHKMGDLLKQITEQKTCLTERDDKIDQLATELTDLKKSHGHGSALEKLTQEKDEALQASAIAMKDLEQSQADNRRLENELLATIQKKIKLSQQVEQWQLDMEEMVENQVRVMFLLEQKTKSSTPVKANNANSSSSTPSSTEKKPAASSSLNRSFSFFRRKQRPT